MAVCINNYDLFIPNCSIALPEMEEPNLNVMPGMHHVPKGEAVEGAMDARLQGRAPR